MTTNQRKETASQKYRPKFKENPELHADPLRRERARDSKRREVVKKMEADEDLRILARERIRLKERMQATRNRRKEEQVKQSGTRYNSPRTLGKAVVKVKRNLSANSTKAVEFVKKKLLLNSKDSDNKSINEESPPTSYQASKPAAEACHKTSGTVCAAVLSKDICAGLYVVVQLLCKSGKKNYSISLCGGGGCQRDMEEDGEIKVQFLATIDSKRFTEIVNDISSFSVKTLSGSWKRQRKVLMEI
ncbi:hypothetical protein TNCT_540391 [Trichonephila clavata]|uniref:Uncharacterized protein n=1 Tax=Trichonephila clavata TaxID=2740835 RepID=A0A8X6J952_TRICU|nr:hypothetical protein TNCT_540391 [Trichonephila clavata]